MTVSDELLDAAKRNDHVAYELINGWSFSAAQAARRQRGAGRLDDRQRDAPDGAHAAGRARAPISPPAIAYADGLAAAAAVRCPALVILGARDIMAPPRNAQALIAALRGRPASSTLPECGHALMAEQPDAVLDALRAFL